MPSSQKAKFVKLEPERVFFEPGFVPVYLRSCSAATGVAAKLSGQG